MTRRASPQGQADQPKVKAVALAVPTFAFTGHEIIFSLFLPAWLTTQMGLNIALAGVVLFILKLLDTLNDPIMGAISDATQSAFGRRKIWMIRGLPIVVLSTALLFLTPMAVSTPYLLVLLFALTTGWTMVNVPHGAWALETGRTPQESARIFGYRTITGLIAAPCFLFAPFVLERVGFTDTRLHMAVMAILIIISLPISLLILARQVADQSGKGPLSIRLIMKDYVSIIFNRNNFYLIAMFYMAGIGFSIHSGLSIFLIHHTFLLSQWTNSFLFMQTIFGIIGIFIWIKLQSATGTIRTLNIVIFLLIALAILLLILPSGNFTLYMAFSAIKGLSTGALFMILRVILSQSIKGTSQNNKAGTHYAAYHLVFNLAAALTTFAVFLGLSLLGFDPKGPENPDHGIALRAVAGAGELIVALGLLVLSRKLRT
ncbi:MAG: MFS transporter [Asticcacaulis sp.]